MKRAVKHIKLYGTKEISLVLALALLLISELMYSQSAASNRFKRIDYGYDLISGKVNTVSYQKDSVDQFIHQYSYDADNRITKVETSSDNVIWDIDAKYFYYSHGPLSRTELGNNKVQGVDYAYTLQGWIKGVNSNNLDKSRDMGQDALANEIYDPANPQLHSNVATDAFGYTLNYFQKDYRAINVLRWSDVTNRFEADASNTSTLKTNRFDLFNGNISSMVTTITQLDSTAAGLVKAQIPKPLGNAYKYDQLNRLKKSVSFNNTDIPNNLWLSSGQAVANMYSNTFTYDANGNILSQNRSNELGTEFDAMNYKYKRDANNKFLQNRLYHVNDNTTYTALKTDDIDDEGTFTSDNLLINTNNNYSYDAIGNLTKDKAEQIDKIEWTVYGKIKSITRIGGSTKDNLVFDYDASGNRISKKVLDNGNNIKYTIYYVRDAQGNVMSTYEHKYIAPAGGAGTPQASYVLQEQHLYGSSRLGMNTPNKQLIYPTIISNGTVYNHLQGLKQFELSNHLGNVLAVITDRKLPVDNNGDNIIDYYQSDITSTSDYSAFGVKLYNRGFSFDKYRYGFNGKENDDEVKGGGNSVDFGARIYDSRLGRWLSLDPKQKKYPNLSPYNAFENNPICFNDPDGRDAGVTVTGNNIKISTTIYIYGTGATAATAAQMQSDIMSAWGGANTYTDPETKTVYNVKFDIQVKLYEGKEKNDPLIVEESWNSSNTDNFIEVTDDSKRSQVTGGDEGVWRGKGRGGALLSQDDPAAHETGHLLGLTDRYTDDKGVNPGWNGNIMGEAAMAGSVQQKNIDAIVAPIVSEYKDYMKGREEIINSNNELNKTSQYIPIPASAYKKVPSATFTTKIDDSSMNK